MDTLTVEQVANMEAGADLDRLIAERVMGETGDIASRCWPFECPSCNGGWFRTLNPHKPPDQWIRQCKDMYQQGCGWEGPIADCHFPPAYSTEIAEAMKAAEKLDLFKGLALTKFAEWAWNQSYDELEWGWAMVWDDLGRQHAVGFGGTPALAICRTALSKVLEGKE